MRITFDKPLQTVTPGRADLNKAAVFTAPIPMIAPGRKMTVVLDSVPAMYEDGTVPLSYTATASYLDHREKRRVEEYVLDLTPYLQTTAPPDGLPEIASALKAIKTDLHNVVNHGHIRVKSSNLDVDRRREDREARMWRGKLERRQASPLGPVAVRRSPVQVRVEMTVGWSGCCRSSPRMP